jgi:hypothetical protein
VTIHFFCNGTTIDDLLLDICLQSDGTSPKTCGTTGACGVTSKFRASASSGPLSVVYNLSAAQSFCGSAMTVTITE